MNILVMDNVSRTFGDKVILDNVSLGIEKGEKIALLGIRVLDEQIEEEACDYQLLQELASSRQELEGRHEHLLKRWAYLHELAEKIVKQR